MADIIHSSEKDVTWDRYWSYRSIERELDFCRTDGLLPVFKRFLPKNGLILEAGCGIGRWVIYFKKRGYNIIGLDNNPTCLSKIKAYDKKIKTIQGRVELLPIEDNILSAYISLGVIEHFEQGPHDALKEAYRVLKKGGLAIVEVPYLNILRKIILPFKRLFRIIRRKLNREPQNYYFAEFRYTVTELKKFLGMAGFEIIFVAPKDDTSPNRNIGLWLDFSFLRNKTKDDCEHAMNFFGSLLSQLFNFISPWISCACVVCVGRAKKL